MVLQFVGEYVIAFLLKTLHLNDEGFFVFKSFWKNLMDNLKGSNKNGSMQKVVVLIKYLSKENALLLIRARFGFDF